MKDKIPKTQYKNNKQTTTLTITATTTKNNIKAAI